MQAKRVSSVCVCVCVMNVLQCRHIETEQGTGPASSFFSFFLSFFLSFWGWFGD
jgi:hypothetical protein